MNHHLFPKNQLIFRFRNNKHALIYESYQENLVTIKTALEKTDRENLSNANSPKLPKKILSQVDEMENGKLKIKRSMKFPQNSDLQKNRVILH